MAYREVMTLAIILWGMKTAILKEQSAAAHVKILIGIMARFDSCVVHVYANVV